MITLQHGLVFDRVILADNGFGEYIPVQNLDSVLHYTVQDETIENEQDIPDLI